jgi:hypothetical protein
MTDKLTLKDTEKLLKLFHDYVLRLTGAEAGSTAAVVAHSLVAYEIANVLQRLELFLGPQGLRAAAERIGMTDEDFDRLLKKSA